jgi:hypothetical protein
MAQLSPTSFDQSRSHDDYALIATGVGGPDRVDLLILV